MVNLNSKTVEELDLEEVNYLLDTINSELSKKVINDYVTLLFSDGELIKGNITDIKAVNVFGSILFYISINQLFTLNRINGLEDSIIYKIVITFDKDSSIDYRMKKMNVKFPFGYGLSQYELISIM